MHLLLIVHLLLTIHVLLTLILMPQHFNSLAGLSQTAKDCLTSVKMSNLVEALAQAKGICWLIKLLVILTS